MAKRKARDLKKVASWHKRVSSQRRSGGSVRQYCRENGLTESAFWFWKGELQKRAAEKRTRHLATARGLRRPGGWSSLHGSGPVPRVPSLVPVAIGGAITSAAPVEVVLRRGVNVRVAADCDETLLRMALSVLESKS